LQTSNLILDFEFDQYLESHKHVINIIMGFRDMGCYTPRAIKARDKATQRVASSWRIWSPIKGTHHPQASYMSLDREVSFTSLYVGWHRAVQVFPPGIT
jgi:hypothetical protein